MVFFMFALRTGAPPAGTESCQNATLCGKPLTLVKRTVAPTGIVIVLGSNAARVLPLPVIFTSTTGPAGAAVLNANMKNTIDNLSGPFLQQNETYEVSFANAPKGTYKAYCTPHQAIGMKIAIKVE